MAQVIKRAVIIAFHPTTYTADILILEATTTTLQGVACATSIDGTSAVSGANCALLLFDEHNLNDGCIIAIYPNGSFGVPSPPPGRTVFVTPYQQIANVAFAVNQVQTFSMEGPGSGIPAGALGVLFKAYFGSPTVGAYMYLGPHGTSTLGSYASLGNIAVANQTINASGIIPVDNNGNIDVQGLGGACNLNLFTYGYVM